MRKYIVWYAIVLLIGMFAGAVTDGPLTFKFWVLDIVMIIVAYKLYFRGRL